MMDGYIDFLERLFPAIDPYTSVRAKEAVKEFSRYDAKTPYFTKPLDKDFQQGDIFSKVPFTYINSKGIGKVILTGGMLLTNSCDAIRSKRLQFAAMFPLSEYSTDPERQKVIKSNTNYDYLYFPDSVVSDSFINFGLITSVSRNVFEEFLKEGKTNRVASLNATGYFLFITKLTVFFMRPEDGEVYASRGAPLV